jgi:hypothetical protein
MSREYTQLHRPLMAFAKGGVQVRLDVGTLVRRPFRAAGATHFLASQDGRQWLAYYTTEDIEDQVA